MKEKLIKYWKYVLGAVVILILIFSAQKCNNNQIAKIEGQKIELQKKLDGVNIAIKKNDLIVKKRQDSISKDNTLKDKRIAELTSKTKTLESNLVKSAEKLKKQKEEIANYNYIQIAEALNDRYETTAVTATESSVNLQRDTPNLVLSELAEKDAQEEDLDTQRGIITNQKEELDLTKGKLLNENLKVAIVESERDLFKSGFEVSQEKSTLLEKQVKSLKTKTVIGKILFYGGIVGSFIVGTQITK